MNAVLSWIASGGALIFSSPSVAVRSVSMLVALAIEGRLPMPPAVQLVTFAITEIDEGAHTTALLTDQHTYVIIYDKIII